MRTKMRNGHLEEDKKEELRQSTFNWRSFFDGGELSGAFGTPVASSGDQQGRKRFYHCIYCSQAFLLSFHSIHKLCLLVSLFMTVTSFWNH